jgi:hypothetical protein
MAFLNGGQRREGHEPNARPGVWSSVRFLMNPCGLLSHVGLTVPAIGVQRCDFLGR